MTARQDFDPGLLAAGLSAVADQTATTSPAPLASLAAVSNEGILVISHPDNDSTSRIRVATNAASNVGVPLAPGQSWTFKVDNAADLLVCLEAGVAGAAKVIACQA